MKHLLRLTTDTEGENFVSGFSLIDDCLWPLIIRAIDTTLSFVTSIANLELFQMNYKCSERFVSSLKIPLGSGADELLALFNLSTYTEFVAM